MIYLLLTVILNTVIFVFFKLFPVYKVDTLQAIVVNYITCVITGCLFLGEFPIGKQSISQPWFPWALTMGVLYISIFNFIAYSTRRFGITTATVANKLSLVIPVLFSVWLYKEQLSAWNIAGILLAFPAVYFSTKGKDDKNERHGFILPALLFVLSGGLDTLTKYVEHRFLQSVTQQAVFPVHVFAVAGILGICLVTVLAIQNKTVLHYRNILAGVLLGVPNYFSIYCLIRMLNSNDIQSSTAIALNNIGIVVACAIAAILFLKEQVTKLRIAGLVLAVFSILLIAWHNA